jgi:hypothetical protein
MGSDLFQRPRQTNDPLMGSLTRQQISYFFPFVTTFRQPALLTELLHAGSLTHNLISVCMLPSSSFKHLQPPIPYHSPVSIQTQTCRAATQDTPWFRSSCRSKLANGRNSQITRSTLWGLHRHLWQCSHLPQGGQNLDWADIQLVSDK